MSTSSVNSSIIIELLEVCHMSLVVLDFLLSEQFEFVKLLEQSRGVLFRVWIVNHGVEEVCHGNIETFNEVLAFE